MAERMTDALRERTVAAAGDVAGAVMDPKAGLSKVRGAVLSARTVLGLAALVAAYLFGRWQTRH